MPRLKRIPEKKSATFSLKRSNHLETPFHLDKWTTLWWNKPSYHTLNRQNPAALGMNNVLLTPWMVSIWTAAGFCPSRVWKWINIWPKKSRVYSMLLLFVWYMIPFLYRSSYIAIFLPFQILQVLAGSLATRIQCTSRCPTGYVDCIYVGPGLLHNRSVAQPPKTFEHSAGRGAMMIHAGNHSLGICYVVYFTWVWPLESLQDVSVEH